MNTKEQIQAEIDSLKEEYLDELYILIKGQSLGYSRLLHDHK